LLVDDIVEFATMLLLAKGSGMPFQEELFKFRAAHQVMKEALLAEINRLLQDECTDKQREFFHERVYAGGISMKSDHKQVMQAYDLVCRTVAKNRAERKDIAFEL
jgi:hypothetical protein